jgi:hypothetical protein
MKKTLLFISTCFVALQMLADDSTNSETLTSQIPVGFKITVLDPISQTCEISGLTDKTMTTVNIPSAIVASDNSTYKVTSIGDMAFYDETAITEVTIPETVVTIAGHAFSECTGLTSIEIPNSVTSIGSWAFAACSNLQSVTLSTSLTEIPMLAFANCSSLTSIDIPSSVTSLGAMAFYDCVSLKSVTISSAVTTFGSSVWSLCKAIKEITYLATVPVSATTDLFSSDVYKNATLTVLNSSATLVDSTAPWNEFSSKDYVNSVVAGIDNIGSDLTDSEPIEVYNIKGIKVSNSAANLPAGFYIVRQGAATKKLIVK